MEGAAKEKLDGVVACDGCQRPAIVLRVAAGAKLCEDCTAKSDRIDEKLASVQSDDPVSCDGCGDRVDFDARVAVIGRELGGAVFCERCEPASGGQA